MPNGIVFNVRILQQGAWDIDKQKFDRIDLTPFLNFCIDDYTNFYIKRHKNYKLSWAYGLVLIKL